MSETGKMANIQSDEYAQLAWDRVQCSGCLSCVVVCSERHTGSSAPAQSHIRIRVGLFDGQVTAEYCRQCAEAACAVVCPAEAISFDEALHYWRVDETLCIGCGECVDACPFQAIRLDEATVLAAKCDLCLGAIHCVEVCPTQALSWK